MDSEKEHQRRRIKTVRTLSYVGLFLAALAWAYFVWPTPYQEWSNKGFVYRKPRWGGHSQILITGRWQPTVKNEQPEPEDKEP